jgi:hypothetical protein
MPVHELTPRPFVKLIGLSEGSAMRTIVLVGIFLTASAPAWSQQREGSANNLLPECRAIARDMKQGDWFRMFKQGFCLGVMSGVMGAGGSRLFCSPTGTTLSQALAVAVRYIDKRPERWHEEFNPHSPDDAII